MSDNEYTIKNESAQMETDSSVAQDDYSQQNDKIQVRYSLVSLRSMIQMDIPPRNWIAYPMVQERAIAMLYAPRGLGKTYVAMTLALGVAAGTSVLGFKIDTPHTVVYVDGEMAASDFKERAINLCFGLGINSDAVFDNLFILSGDLQPKALPNLGVASGQNQINALLQQADLVILDNLSVLSAFGRENEAESWTYMQQWLLKLKLGGKSILVIDHSGKNQDNRGTSKKQDIMDTVVSLTKPDSYKQSDGARFILTYNKSRNVCGEDVEPREYRLQSTESGELSWLSSVPSKTSADKNAKHEAECQSVADLRAQGKSYREISEITGMSKTKVGELAKQGVRPIIESPDVKIDKDGVRLIEIDDLDKMDF